MIASPPSLLLVALTLWSAAGMAAAAGKTELRFIQKVEDAPGQTVAVRKGGFQDSLGQALAKQLKMTPRFIGLPRKRMMGALEAGDGDIVCGYLPAWFQGEVNWTRPFIPTSEVLVASRRVPKPASLEDVRGKTVGTVLGFHYPDITQQLGAGFVRDDAPSIELTVRKWQAGRFDYFVTTGQSIAKQFPKGELASGYTLLVISAENSGCAVSRKGNVTVAEINSALDAMEKNGELARVLRLR